MILSLLCVCLSLISVLSHTPTPCCSPVLYEGWMVSGGSRYNSKTKEFKFFETKGTIHFSTHLHRRVVIQNADDPATMIREINDFKGGRDYTIKNGTCTISDQFWPSDDCIDATAKLVTSTSVGNGVASVDVDVWFTTFGPLSHTTTVSEDKCFHLEKTWYGTFGEISIEGTRIYTDLKEGVNDTSVFDIPDFCTEDPPKCCLPTNYTASIVDFGSTVNTGSKQQNLIHNVGTIYTDGTNNFQFITEQDDTGVQSRMDQYLDYNTQTISFVRNGACIVIPQNFTLVKCIPDDATLVASTFIGSPFEPLKVNIWDFLLDGRKTRLAVTAEGCFPYFDNYHYNFQNQDFSAGFLYGAIQPSLQTADLAKMTVPAICNQAG